MWAANNFEAESLENLAKQIGHYYWENEIPGDVIIDNISYNYDVEAPKSTVIAVEKDARAWNEYFIHSEKENKAYERECGTRIYDRF